ncbi:MAG: dTDP-glucose 4,6-dehydratase [Thermodesulfovibrionales bacterium]
MTASYLQNANMLVTGGAGFIGSWFIRLMLNTPGYRGRVVNFDKLTYAGNLGSIEDVRGMHEGSRYFFEHGDIRDYDRVSGVFQKYGIGVVVHFAAESHVDRSIFGPKEFVETNISGTFTLLEAARRAWGERKDVRFHHISTDEVYGSLGEAGLFAETTPYDPRSPYSASKAASDHLVRAYHHTYGLPATISNCSNNYGPYQFPEKLVPLMILNCLEGKPLPVYGDGGNVRDWLYVEDHCEAVVLILEKGRAGQTYNIGGECEKTNIDVVEEICRAIEEISPSAGNPNLKGKSYRDLISFVPDRPGHDRRYAIDCTKIKQELGWRQRHDFGSGLRETVRWYLRNSGWVESVRSGEYRDWLAKNYGERSRGTAD